MLCQQAKRATLFRVDIQRSTAEIILSFALPAAPLLSCCMGDGPTMCLQHGPCEFCICLRGSSPDASEQSGQQCYQQHHLKLQGTCSRRVLLLATTDQRSTACAGDTGLLHLLLSCGCGDASHAAVVISAQALPDEGVTWLMRLALGAAEGPRLTAAVSVPAPPETVCGAASSGGQAPADSLALATSDGHVCLFRDAASLPRQGFLQACLEAISETGAKGKEGADRSESRARAHLARVAESSLDDRLYNSQADSAEGSEPVRAQLMSRADLGQPVRELTLSSSSQQLHALCSSGNLVSLQLPSLQVAAHHAGIQSVLPGLALMEGSYAGGELQGLIPYMSEATSEAL